MREKKPLPDRTRPIPARCTLKELADIVGKHYMTIWRWEQKGWIPSPTKLPRTRERVYNRELIERIIAFADDGTSPFPPSSSDVPSKSDAA